MAYQVDKSDAEWREQLSKDEYAVLRKAGTERAFTGEYTDTKTIGVYRCKACDAELFRSETKFDSHCGWPSFYAPLAEDRVEYIEDSSMFMKRVEVRCANCGSHLGHVFDDGYGTPTGQRYCINSISMKLEPADQPVASSTLPDGVREVDRDHVRLHARGVGQPVVLALDPHGPRAHTLAAGDVGVEVVADHPGALQRGAGPSVSSRSHISRGMPRA